MKRDDKLDYSWFDSSLEQKLSMIMSTLLDIQDELDIIKKQTSDENVGSNET